jgi:virginiamycin B lyase
VETKANALGRMDAQGRVTEWPVKTPDASLRGVTVAPDGDLWFTENFSNKIGRMAPDGTVIGEYAIASEGCGARAIIAVPDGRLFFSAHDAGAIGEVIPRR